MEDNQETPKYSLKMMWEFIFIAEIVGFIVIPAFCLRFLSLSVFTVLPLLPILLTFIAWLRLARQVKRSYKTFRRFPKRPHRRSTILAVFAALSAGGLVLGHAVEFLIGDLRSNFGNVVPITLGFFMTFLLWKMYPALMKIYTARKRLRRLRLKNEQAYGTA
jgi:hypothetical protein